MKSNVYKDYLKNYFEPLLKILFCIIVILVVRLSGLEDLSFILSKKSANATVLEIIKREGIRKPYQVRVNYYNGENNIEDFSINMRKIIVLLFFAFIIKQKICSYFLLLFVFTKITVLHQCM